MVTGVLASMLGAVMALPALGGSAAALPSRTAPPRPASTRTYQAAAGPAPLVVGVDNAPPPGKSWEYTHYFPESNVNVPQGGTVLFEWNQAAFAGFHSVTFVPAGQTQAQVRANYPTIASDSDNGESESMLAPASILPSNPACLAGPTAPPCVFDGQHVVNSGIIPTQSGAVFPVQIASSVAPGTYTYFCSFHPGMSGTLNVVAAGQPATPAATVAAQAGAELNQLNAAAAPAEAAANVPTSTANPDGTRTWTVHVGLTVDDVDLLEYLPANVPIRKGDSVKFDGAGTSQEVHTATSFGGSSLPAGPGPGQCESAAGPDTPAAPGNGPPELSCTDPSGFEQPVGLHTLGVPSVITSGSTPVAAVVSGRSDAQAAGSEASHTYKVPNNGTYVFFCAFHPMAVIVSTPGYRVAASNGSVYTFGAADFFGSKGASPPPSPVVATPATLDNQGYWLVTADGHTYNYGDAASVGNIPVHPASPIVAASASSDGGGLWLVAKDGGVFALGDATYFGSMGGKHLNAPIVGIDDGYTDSGYDLVASDGGVFSFGTTNGGPRFFGSMGGKHLNAPIVAIQDDLTNGGYLMAAADGGVFTFGDATYVGGLGATKLAAPIVSFQITATNFPVGGYRMVAADGGVFDFGGAPFFGSPVANHPGPVVGINGDA
jgi:plastocyanin